MLIVDSKIEFVGDDVTQVFYTWHEKRLQYGKGVRGGDVDVIYWEETRRVRVILNEIRIVFKNKKLDEIFDSLIRNYEDLKLDYRYLMERNSFLEQRHQKICNYFGEDLEEFDRATFSNMAVGQAPQRQANKGV